MICIPPSYLASRQIFLAQASAAGAHTGSFLHGVDAESDVPLITDVALLGAKDAQVMVVMSSGIHGVEGYAGAACQVHFMERYRSVYRRPQIAFLLVHAVNPWGFLHDRRVTEENVDLNRNFIEFGRAVAPVSRYSIYHDRLVSNYKPLPYGLWNEVKLIAGAVTPKRWKAAQAAITTGQYTHPDGLFFGGTGPCRSRVIWEEILRTYVTDCKCAVLLDIHTGLGKRGAAELVSYLPSFSEQFKHINSWFSGRLHSMATGQSVSAAVEGAMIAAFCRATPARSYAIGLEFGTKAPLAVLNALRADQWCRNNQLAPREKIGRRVRENLKNAFVATDSAWCRQVTRHFDQVMDELVDAAEKQPCSD
ncbi:MAG: DUF2817 domain-containing protein [Noviherbaspirillum sp.]